MTRNIAEILAKKNITILESQTDAQNTPIAVIDKHLINNTANILKESGFDILISVSAIDTIQEIVVMYDFYGTETKERFIIKANLDRNTPEINTVSDTYKSADWHEREAYDLMGVKFLKHPNLKRILLPEGWIGHPLRKDYKSEDERLKWNER